MERNVEVRTVFGPIQQERSRPLSTTVRSTHILRPAMQEGNRRIELSRESASLPHRPNKRGVRIYLDHYRMIDDHLVVRDGLHYSKVKDSLPLDGYMIHYVEGYKIRDKWTPKGFCDFATDNFENHVQRQTNGIR